MIAIFSTKTGKPFFMEDNRRTLTSQKTIKTATVFHDEAKAALNEWFKANGANNLEVRFIQCSTLENEILRKFGPMKYNRLKKLSSELFGVYGGMKK